MQINLHLLKDKKVKTFAYIFISQVIFVISNFYVSHKIADNWGTEGFALYSILKRFTNFVTFPLLCGIGISIPVYISKNIIYKEKVKAEYLLAGTIIFFSLFAIFSIFIIIFPSLLKTSLNINISLTIEIIILVMIFSQCMFQIATAYLRGILSFNIFTGVNIIVLSIFPLLCYYMVDDVYNYFLILSLFSIGIISPIFLKEIPLNIFPVKNLKEKIIDLASFGSPRIFGEIALYALDFIPVFLVNLYFNANQVAYVTITLMLLKLATMPYSVVGNIILPFMGRIYTEKTREYFYTKVKYLLIIGLLASIAICTFLFFLTPIIVNLFFKNLKDATYFTQISFLSLPFKMLYIILRNILDVMSKKAFNTLNLILTLCCQIGIIYAGIYFNNEILFRCLSIVIPNIILGLLTLFTYNKLKRQQTIVF